MAKTLTEQWRDGELFGFHYVKVPKEETGIHNVSSMDYLLDEHGVEVLSAVPRYEQFIGLMDDSKELDKAYDKINLLGKRLEIATNALKDIKEHTNKLSLPSYTGMVCYKALKEMEGVK